MSYLEKPTLFRQTPRPIDITVRFQCKVSRQDEEGQDGKEARAGDGEPQRVQEALDGLGPRPEERVGHGLDGVDCGLDCRGTWRSLKVWVRQHLDRIGGEGGRCDDDLLTSNSNPTKRKSVQKSTSLKKAESGYYPYPNCCKSTLNSSIGKHRRVAAHHNVICECFKAVLNWAQVSG